MKSRKWLMSLIVSLAIFSAVGLWVPTTSISEDQKIPRVGPVAINPPPASLEGKTVLLRWNGKFNGDKFLNRVGELLALQVKKLKIIKMWEVDSSTAAISKDAEVSEKVAWKIARLKPDMVIAAQAD